MKISLEDLPPKYREQAWRKLIEQDRQRKREPIPSSALPKNAKPPAGKYHNRPTERVTEAGAVLRFDSQREARRYDELLALQKAGEIRDLRLQVDFTLQEAYTGINGCRIRAIRYRADFTYYRPAPETTPKTRDHFQWVLVVEDVKSRGTRTKEYLLKRKLMRDRYGIDIVEV